MKVKDFLKSIAAQAAVKDTDLETVLSASALNEIDLPDTFINSFNNEFLTKERAKNDPSIVSEIQKTANRNIFNTFDEKALEFAAMLESDDQEKIKTAKTFERFDIIRAGLKKILAAKSAGKSEADVRKVEEEWSNKLKAAEDLHKSQIDKFKNDYDTMMVDSMVKNKILSYNFGEAFTPLKESIADLTVNKLRSGFKLAHDKGSIAVMQDVDGILRDAYEGNTKVTIESLLEKELKPFIAVSNSKGGNNNKKDEKLPANFDRSKASLAELRQMQAQGLIN